jgi:hypothetical protein
VSTDADALITRLHEFDWAGWRKSFGADFRAIYEEGLQASADEAVDEYRKRRKRVKKAADDGVAFDLDDPFTQHFMTAYVGERISQLEQTTKDDVIRIIRNRFDDQGDKSIATLRDEIFDAVGEKFESYEEYRATRIARTETGITFNHGTALAAAQNEFDLDVIDGDDDDESAAANGEIWSPEEALADPLEHPNCVRDFAPHVEDLADEADE